MTRPLALPASLRALQSPATLAALDGARVPAKPRRAPRKAAAKPRRPKRVAVGVLVSSRVEADGAVVARCENLRVNNPNNNRRHWRHVAREARETKAAVHRALATKTPPAGARWTVTMTREGRGVLDEECGLNASLKHVRDAVGEWLETGDAPSAPVAWRYEQRRAKGYAVTVRVEVAK